MKKALFALTAILFISGCAAKMETNRSSSGDSDLIKKYQKEGFVSNNEYVTIIIKSDKDSSSISDIESQIKNRTLSSLQKYLSENGKQPDNNRRAKILNLINDSGSLKKFDDIQSKRFVYVFSIRKDNLKAFISEF
ncbi:MAG: hypothetical protein KAZ87_03865 [Spirochaetes bacterium]|nr:hypothetical protein [Spirochaetota bacterium]